jgi:hypothetical protein
VAPTSTVAGLSPFTAIMGGPLAAVTAAPGMAAGVTVTALEAPAAADHPTSANLFIAKKSRSLSVSWGLE